MIQRNAAGYLKRIAERLCGDDLELQKAELIAECPEFCYQCWVVYQARQYLTILKYFGMEDCFHSTLGQWYVWEWN